MSVVRPSVLLLLVLSFFAVEIPAARFAAEDQVFDVNQVAAVLKPMLDNVRQGRAQSTTTLTVLKTTTISSVTTTTITTKRTCGVLASVVAGTVNGITTFTTTPAVTCRRKRQFWNQPIFLALNDEHDDAHLQYYRLSPSEVLSLEPTLLPQFRNTNRKPSLELIKDSPLGIETSFDSKAALLPPHMRLDSRFAFGGGLSSIISSIVSNILVSTSTATSTLSFYTSTSTSTSYSATATYYVVGSCYPSGLGTC